MLRLLPLPAAEVVEVLQVLLMVGEVVEVGRVDHSRRNALSLCSSARCGAYPCDTGTGHRGCRLVSARLCGVHLGHERRVVKRHGPLHEASSPNAYRSAGLRHAAVRTEQASSPLLSPFVSGDVEVRFPEQLLGGGQRLL
jgi:hypothetical protein